MDSFLRLIGLSDRELFPNQRDFSCTQDINWEAVDEKLDALVKRSRDWLDQTITTVKQKNYLAHTPRLVEDIHHCCGYGACYASCPTGSVIMLHNDEGFEYPYINPHTCIGCNKCVDACCFKADQKLKGMF